MAHEIQSIGGKALPLTVDVRSYESIQSMVASALSNYGRIDVLIYNAGAIWWSAVRTTPMQRFKLLQQVNPEGLYGCVQAVLPEFERQGNNGRIVVVCPPIYSRFFRGKTAYAMGKVGMSVLVKGLAMDFEREGHVHGKLRGDGMAIFGIWPATASDSTFSRVFFHADAIQAIESAATARMVQQDPQEARDLRRPSIFSDAILAMLDALPERMNGQLELDEDFLRDHCGITDFSKYSIIPGSEPRRIMPRKFPNLLVEEQSDEGRRVDSTRLPSPKL